jgi:hypothetical protein
MARPKPVPERKATGETERVYHEIKKTLRVSGVNLNFRTLAGYGKALPLLWDEARCNLETRNFEDGADRIRSRAAQGAQFLAASPLRRHTRLGDSQRYQIQNALKLYHYVNPKLLLLTSALKVSLHGESIGREDSSQGHVPEISLGVPPRMYPMEMVSELTRDIRLNNGRLRNVLDDIKRTLTAPALDSEYRTLALWPDYLADAWDRLKPVIATSMYLEAAMNLRQLSLYLARNLPYPMAISLDRLEEVEKNPRHVLKTIERFETLLPFLILNNCILLDEWFDEAQLRASPYPISGRKYASDSKVYMA